MKIKIGFEKTNGKFFKTLNLIRYVCGANFFFEFSKSIFREASDFQFLMK
jgi:hypothetical protein